VRNKHGSRPLRVTRALAPWARGGLRPSRFLRFLGYLGYLGFSGFMGFPGHSLIKAPLAFQLILYDALPLLLQVVHGGSAGGNPILGTDLRWVIFRSFRSFRRGREQRCVGGWRYLSVDKRKRVLYEVVPSEEVRIGCQRPAHGHRRHQLRLLFSRRWRAHP